MIKSMPLRTGRSELGHPDEVLAVHERILAVSPAQGRDIKVGSGRRVHVIEAGKGPPSRAPPWEATPPRCCFPCSSASKDCGGSS